MKLKSKKIIDSFKYAFQGICTSFRNERNIKIHILIMLLVILSGVFLRFSKEEWMICILLFAIVIAGELFNTSIETIVDIIMPEKNEKAKIAKDVAAGAVLVLAISAAMIGFMIMIPKIIR